LLTEAVGLGTPTAADDVTTVQASNTVQDADYGR